MSGLSVTCNICGSANISPFKNRKVAKCECGAMERTRGLFALIEQENLVKPGMKVMHVAPEAGLGRKLKSIVGEKNYFAYDLQPEYYPEDLKVSKLDLCHLEGMPSGKFDFIIHSHVLEHIPCEVSYVLWHLQRCLTDKGRHLFCIPVFPGKTFSDFSDLTDLERHNRFGQKDHVRQFGADDMDMNIGRVLKLHEKSWKLKVPQAVADKHAFSPREVERSMFLFRKSDLLLTERALSKTPLQVIVEFVRTCGSRLVVPGTSAK